MRADVGGADPTESHYSFFQMLRFLVYLPCLTSKSRVIRLKLYITFYLADPRPLPVNLFIPHLLSYKAA